MFGIIKLKVNSWAFKNRSIWYMQMRNIKILLGSGSVCKGSKLMCALIPLKKIKAKKNSKGKQKERVGKKWNFLLSLLFSSIFLWCNHKLIPCTKRILLLLIIIIICNLSSLDVYEEMFLFVEPQSLLYLATKLQITLHNKGGRVRNLSSYFWSIHLLLLLLFLMLCICGV